MKQPIPTGSWVTLNELSTADATKISHDWGADGWDYICGDIKTSHAILYKGDQGAEIFHYFPETDGVYPDLKPELQIPADEIHGALYPAFDIRYTMNWGNWYAGYCYKTPRGGQRRSYVVCKDAREDNTGNFVAEVKTGPMFGPDQVHMTARLIAGAPTMYSALTDIMAADNVPEEIYHIARKALEGL